MAEFFFISYSSVDGKDFAMKLADELAAGPPPITVWLDKRRLRPGEDWDEQIVEALRACKGLIFVASVDSVHPQSMCKNEWARALKYKKPIIPLLLHRDAELPFRLGSREYIRFDEAYDPAMARLRKYLVWMDAPEGQLQALKYRLADARRQLPRTDAEHEPRIREDIEELERQIAQQQTTISNPKAAEQRVRQSIETGLESERAPARPVGGIGSGKFINPPPLIAPTWFQDRHVETGQIGAFLKDDSLRLMTVVGRGGVGKTAMVCRLLRSLEGGQLPDEGGPLSVDGIVYLSAARSFHKVNVPDLYAALTKLLPDDIVKQLDAVYKNPQATTRDMIEGLVQVFPRGRAVVLLDNFEDMLDVETGRIKDPELNDALRAFLELPPHGLKFIITTRVAPTDLALMQPGLQRRLDLDKGLEHPYAENILRAMDADGKVGLRDAPAMLLAKASERTLGYPRALEHLFGILSADRDTSLQEILDNTRQFLPEQVVAVLVGEAFSHLDATAQAVMQALAIYRYPVPPAAVDYLLQPSVPGIDGGRVLSRLVNMQFVRRDAGRYYLHQVDRDYALGRIPEGQSLDREAVAPPLTRSALRHRAAEWFKLSRKPREDRKSLGDLAAQLSEFELRCEGGDYDTAAAVLHEFDFDNLFLWGHYRLMTELHERLQGNITDPALTLGNTVSLAAAYYRMGLNRKAIVLYERTLELARAGKDRVAEGDALGNLAAAVTGLGESARAAGYLEQALAIRRETGDRAGESQDLANLAVLLSQRGQRAQAVEYSKLSLQIDRELELRRREGFTLDNLGGIFMELGRLDEALRYHMDALAIAADIGYRFIEASTHRGIGEVHLLQDRPADAANEFALAIEIADEIGSSGTSKGGREDLALLHVLRNELARACELLETASKIDVPLDNHRTSALVGLVALRQGDATAAKAAFTAALKETDDLIAMTPDWQDALESRALALSGLALCGDAVEHVATAKAAYVAARTVTTDAGVVRWALLLFDALAQADSGGVLAEVRPIVAGLSAVRSASG